MNRACSIVTLALALAAGLLVSPVSARVPSNATTTTNVCLVYQDDGVFSGGVSVIYPQFVSYRFINDSPAALLWLPNGQRLRVEFLSITPIAASDGCVGVLGNLSFRKEI